MSRISFAALGLLLPLLLASDALAGPAARMGDMHVCPGFTMLVPHVGGPITTGSQDVLIGGLPAARVGDLLTCVGPMDSVATGSKTVLINGKGAARLGSMTGHGGTITVGFPLVMIGD